MSGADPEGDRRHSPHVDSAQLGGGARSYTDTTVSIGTTYDYALTATNSEGTGPAATGSATAAACPTTTTTAPPTPQPLTPTFTG